MTIEVKQKIHVYEVDGKEVGPKDEYALRVDSHWNRPEFVVIEMCGIRYTVAIDDLNAAIENAGNIARH